VELGKAELLFLMAYKFVEVRDYKIT